MDKFLFFLLIPSLFSFFTIIFGKVLRWTSNPYLIPPMPNGVTQYLVFHGQLALNSTLSRLRCEAMGGDLADVEDMTTFNYLFSRLHAPSFIASFLGEVYRDTCIALYPGGAVAIPEKGCGRLGSICEVPVYGSHGIDLRSISVPSDPKSRIGKYDKDQLPSNSTDVNIISGEELLKGMVVKGIISNNKDNNHGHHYKQGSITVINPITTVTIYGSIETDPALPCCKCCNPV